ncbi:hypothetical protein BCAR13_700044 [Paraburkholderia caribensis]|nr:hypothetical protein BCAR13_700044 [Paraburkholderia caribensis]
MSKGPHTRPFVFSLGGNDQPPVFNNDLYALSGFEPGVLDPPSCELHPRIKWRLGSQMQRFDGGRRDSFGDHTWDFTEVVGNLLKEYAGAHYEYDARGNLVAKQSPGSEQRYEWDEFNRLGAVSVRSSAGARQAKYFYDAFGRRIAKDVDGERTVFGWDGDRLAYEVAGSQSTHYVYEAGSFVPLAQFVAAPVEGLETPQRRESDRYTPEYDPLMKVSTPNGLVQVYYYHCDVIGTPQMLTGDAGEIVWEARYKAWGEAAEVIARVSAATQAQARNPIRFQGQQADDETGLHYNRHRYYDPHAGRFISRDPIGLAGGLNEYNYGKNPISWIDPLGLAGVDTLTPGPFATESIPARGPARDFTLEERQQVNAIGYRDGCHTCGATEPGTKSGDFIPDHQTPNALNTDDKPQRLYPHCRQCSLKQAGQVTQEKRRLGAL